MTLLAVILMVLSFIIVVIGMLVCLSGVFLNVKGSAYTGIFLMILGIEMIIVCRVWIVNIV